MPNDPFEQPVHQLLRSLPERSAPTTLEARVLAAIAARAALPWWRRPVTQWPSLWRGLFLCVSLLIGAAGVTGFFLLHRHGATATATALHVGPWLETLTIGHAFVTIGHALHLVGEALPSLLPRDWVLGAAAFYAAVILMIFGAYRMLARSV